MDVGCGAGAQLERYQRAGCMIAGIDASPAMLDRARQRLGPVVDLRLAPAQSLPYSDARFELVIASLMLHELEPTVRDAVVSEIDRVLAPDLLRTAALT